MRVSSNRNGAIGVKSNAVVVKFASEMSKKPEPFVKSPECTIRRTLLLFTLDSSTVCDPSFGVLATSSVGKVRPPSVDIRTLTVAAPGKLALPPTSHVTVVEPERF